MTLTIVLSICAVYFYFLSMPRNITSGQAAGGVLDLRSADFERMRHGFSGEWEFYFGEMFTPEDFAEGLVQGGTFLHVPSSWPDSGYPGEGVATYRLTVLTDEPVLMMDMPAIFDASVMWINGEIVAESGVVSGTREDFISGVRSHFIPIIPVDGQLEIIVHIAAYGPGFSGLQYIFVAGEPGVMFRDVLLRRVLTALFIGMLIAMFASHFILFLHRRKELAYLAFALYCLFSAFRFLLETNSIFFHFAYFGVGAYRAYISVATLMFVSLMVFTHLVFKHSAKKWQVCVYGTLTALPLLDAFTMPFGAVFPEILIVLVVPQVMIVASIVRSGKLKGDYYGCLFVFSLVTALLSPFIRVFFVDFLYIPAIASNLFLIMSQFFMLAFSYAAARDAQQRYALENAALESLSQMKSDYMASMSHETKTPLTVISVYVQLAAELFEETGLDDTEISDSLSRAQEEIMRVSQMNDNTLLLASMQMGNEIGINTAELLRNSTEAYRSIIERHGNEFTVNIPDALPGISGNADRLVQVMVKLLTDANKRTQNGKIAVEAISENDSIKVIVKDNGTGIPPDSPSLDICKNTVELYGGKIWIEQDTGTTVMFTMPSREEK